MASLQSQSTLPSTLNASPSLQPQPPNQMNYMDDGSSIAMFTAVGHVGLHLVLRPLVRWGIRSLMLKSKAYDDNNASKRDFKPPLSRPLESESEIQTKLTEDSNDKNESKLKLKKAKTLSNINNGIAGPYSEIVCTFGSLATISYTAHPQNILLYFGISYPSMPFILRLIHTLNDKKSAMTWSRALRLGSKSMIVTMGFGVSMALVGVVMQSIPFFNIFCLAFWDCFADCVISDGPSQ